MRVFERCYFLTYYFEVNDKNTRIRCGTCSKLIIDIIELNKLLWFYINWLFQGEERLINSFAWNKKRNLETDFDSSYTFHALSEPFDGANMYFVCTESFYCGNCLGKKYVQGWKMYLGSFNGILRKSIQNIPQNSLIFRL